MYSKTLSVIFVLKYHFIFCYFLSLLFEKRNLTTVMQVLPEQLLFLFLFSFFSLIFVIGLLLASCLFVAVEKLAYVFVYVKMLMYIANYLMKCLPPGQTVGCDGRF